MKSFSIFSIGFLSVDWFLKSARVFMIFVKSLGRFGFLRDFISDNFSLFFNFFLTVGLTLGLISTFGLSLDLIFGSGSVLGLGSGSGCYLRGPTGSQLAKSQGPATDCELSGTRLTYTYAKRLGSMRLSE